MMYSIANEISNFNDQSLTLSILYDELEYALEADATVANEEEKKSIGRMLFEKVEKIIQEIYAIIDRLFSKLGNIIQRIMVTDKGFKKESRTAIKKNKPLEAVKLIAYQYDDSFLENQMSKMTTTVFNILKNLKTDYVSEKNDTTDEPLDMKKKDLYKYILKQVGCPGDITDMNLYYEYLKKGYRGNKKEQLFKASNTQVYYNNTMEYTKLKQVVNAKESIMKQQVSTIKSNLLNIIKNKLAEDAVKKRAVHHSSNVSDLYNLYSTFLSIYIELKIEKILNYRTVMRKLYHF